MSKLFIVTDKSVDAITRDILKYEGESTDVNGEAYKLTRDYLSSTTAVARMLYGENIEAFMEMLRTTQFGEYGYIGDRFLTYVRDNTVVFVAQRMYWNLVEAYGFNLNNTEVVDFSGIVKSIDMDLHPVPIVFCGSVRMYPLLATMGHMYDINVLKYENYKDEFVMGYTTTLHSLVTFLQNNDPWGDVTIGIELSDLALCEMDTEELKGVIFKRVTLQA